MLRMFCEPTVCWVQPSAYRIVSTRFAGAVDAINSHTFRNWSCGVPVISLTFAGV